MKTVIAYEDLDTMYHGIAAFTRHSLVMEVSVPNMTITLTGGF